MSSEIGKKYGRLTILELAENGPRIKPSHLRYRCLCDCGNEKTVILNNLKRGTTKACGCWQREVASRVRKPNGRVNKRGYRVVPIPRTSPYWPMARKCATSTCNGNIFEHRLIMAQHLGRCLEPWEQVHHINHNRSDNRIENLKLMSGTTEHNSETVAHTHLVKMKDKIGEQESRFELILKVLDHFDRENDCPTNDAESQFRM